MNDAAVQANWVATYGAYAQLPYREQESIDREVDLAGREELARRRVVEDCPIAGIYLAELARAKQTLFYLVMRARHGLLVEEVGRARRVEHSHSLAELRARPKRVYGTPQPPETPRQEAQRVNEARNRGLDGIGRA